MALQALQEHFASYGRINQWAPLATFGRIIIVYEDECVAETAKLESDPVVIESTSDRQTIALRVYRADPNPLIIPDSPTTVPQDAYLRPPPIEKNFLISPPGSPPVGWEQVREDPPNVTPLAVDLIEALRKLQVRSKKGPSVEVLLESEDVNVYVEDCDYDAGEDQDGLSWRDSEEDWDYGVPSPRIKWKPIATALPPLRSEVA
jgi:hypothetical protein